MNSGETRKAGPTPYAIELPQSDLEDLHDRLTRVRWADDVGNDDWRFGVERRWLEGMVAHWRDAYDWRRHEAAMNAFPHFRAEIDSVPIHFLHVRGQGPHPIPLIATHGWPWTFWDLRYLIGPLTDPVSHGGDARDSFDLVIPSLPGFGFSTPLPRAGIDVRAVGRLWVSLMRDVLGYDRFGAYGGDWGAIVTAELGHVHARHLLGVCLSMAVIPRGEPAGADPGPLHRRREMDARPQHRGRLDHLQSRRLHTTDPQTLAYALVDSPVGTAAWIWERRRAWSDCGGDVTSLFDCDDLATTASIYWLTRSIGSSLRLYHEHWASGWPRVHDRSPTIEAPTAFAVFPQDVVFLPRAVAEQHTDLRRWTVMPKGGHFGPAEQPELMVDELRAFFRDLR